MNGLANIERGTIKEKKGDKYIVESLDRSGVITPEIPQVKHGKVTTRDGTYDVVYDISEGDQVFFFLFPDGDGGIISKISR